MRIPHLSPERSYLKRCSRIDLFMENYLALWIILIHTHLSRESMATQWTRPTIQYLLRPPWMIKMEVTNNQCTTMQHLMVKNSSKSQEIQGMCPCWMIIRFKWKMKRRLRINLVVMMEGSKMLFTLIIKMMKKMSKQ